MITLGLGDRRVQASRSDKVCHPVAMRVADSEVGGCPRGRSQAASGEG